jgi:apolipoprotein N-acyltransferase
VKDLYKKIKPFLPYLIAILAGAIMPYAFAPYYMGTVSILSCALFLVALVKQRPARAFLIGGVYGLAMFGFGTNWVYVSIHNYGNAPPVLAAVITALFVMILALYPAILGALLNKFFPKDTATRNLLAFPTLWVILEILRGWVLTGFPWLYLGYTQSGTHLRAFAPIASVWAVSWSVVFVAAVLFMFLNYYYQAENKPKKRYGLVLAMVAIWALAFGLDKIIWTVQTDKKLDVALVQGNIAQLMRWDPQAITNIVATYETLTQDALNSDLIVWPEAAIPVPLPESLSLFKTMDTLTKAHHTALIAGVPTELADKTHYYNSLVAVGMASGIYHKEYLVPFGEYVPLEKYLRGLIGFFNLPMSSIVPGPSDQNLLIAQGYKIAPAICYEIAYPFFVQKMAQNADFILTVSNDAWFGTSIGPAQHLEIAEWRAWETGKYVIRATNTGFTAVINAEGTIAAIAPQFEPQVLHAEVFQTVGQTPWVRYGMWPLLGTLAFLLILAFFLRSREK